MWQTKRLVLMEPVMQVSSRGTNLEQSFDRELTHTAADPKPPLDVDVSLGGVDWLHFTGSPSNFVHLNASCMRHGHDVSIS